MGRASHLIATAVTLPMNTRWNSRKMINVGAASRNSAAHRVADARPVA